MSGTAYGVRASPRRGTQPLRLPRVPLSAPGAQTVNNAFDLLERADSQNLKVGQAAAAVVVLLQSPDGVTWQLSVDNNGALTVQQAPRSAP